MKNAMTILRMRWLSALTLLIAAVAFLGPVVFHRDTAFQLSFVLAPLWVVLTIYGIFRNTKQGLWMLLGTPFALFWFVIFEVLSIRCALDRLFIPRGAGFLPHCL
jgi:hypothetical protein